MPARRTRPSSASAGASSGSSASRGRRRTSHAWLAHQRRDAFWKHGSVCEDFGAIQVPVYMVGGWQDAYTDAVFRLLDGYGGPAKGLVGPWGHLYPHSGEPGPAIGFLQECLRFWDECLKGRETGVLDEPALRAFMQDWVDPTIAPPADRPGRWVAEPVWPVPGAAPRVLHLRADGVLGAQPGDEAEHTIAGSQLTGLQGGDVVRLGRAGRRSGRPARRGRPLALLHVRAARRAGRDPRLPRGAPHARRGPAARARAPSGSATWRPRARRCS